MSADPDPHDNARQRVRRLVADGSGRPTTRSSVLDRVCELAVSEIGLVGAAVTLLPSIDAHVVVGASSPAARRWEQAQFDAGEGPTADATRTRSPVFVADLGREGGRWPGWGEHARGEPVAAVLALPLLLGASSFGALTLYREVAGPLDARELRAAYAFVDIVVELLVDTSSPDDTVPTRLLDEEIDGQAHVYQAQGMVMVQLGATLAEALALMRGRAYARGVTLSALSHDVIAGTTTFTKDD